VPPLKFYLTGWQVRPYGLAGRLHNDVAMNRLVLVMERTSSPIVNLVRRDHDPALRAVEVLILRRPQRGSRGCA
jgi:hypothetical protein